MHELGHPHDLEHHLPRLQEICTSGWYLPGPSAGMVLRNTPPRGRDGLGQKKWTAATANEDENDRELAMNWTLLLVADTAKGRISNDWIILGSATR